MQQRILDEIVRQDKEQPCDEVALCCDVAGS
jgi:hypothetical protein